MQYELPPRICHEINRALAFDSKMAATGLADFVEALPSQLKTAVSIHIYQQTFVTHPFFRGLKNERLLAFFG